MQTVPHGPSCPWIADNVSCCPTVKRRCMSGSPCSPPSLGWAPHLLHLPIRCATLSWCVTDSHETVNSRSFRKEFCGRWSSGEDVLDFQRESSFRSQECLISSLCLPLCVSLHFSLFGSRCHKVHASALLMHVRQFVASCC